MRLAEQPRLAVEHSGARVRVPRVLYLDIEGGFGGSSRSLYHLVAALDRERFQAHVWSRRAGPIQDRLQAIGVAHRVEPRIASIIPLPRKNLRNWLVAGPRLLATGPLIRRIRAFAPDILHLNYEGLAPLHFLLCQAGYRRATVLHFRAVTGLNAVYRLYARHINRHIDQIVFITENERARAIAGGVAVDRIPNMVLYNPADPALLDPERTVARGGPIRVVFLGTLDDNKAPDRLIEIAEIIRARGVKAHIDAFGGAPRYKKWLAVRRTPLEDLRREVDRRNLSHWLTYHGATTEPERAVAEADLLVRVSRLNDPWGRDVIEALSMGTPVLTHGSYDRFVRDRANGRLFPHWDPHAYADAIAEVAADRSKLDRWSAEAKAIARRLFDARTYAAQMMSVYDRLLHERRDAPLAKG